MMFLNDIPVTTTKLSQQEMFVKQLYPPFSNIFE